MKKHLLAYGNSITLLLFFLLWLLPAFSFAQKEINNWCFGNNIGMNFNSGSPVYFSGVAIHMATQEGTSSISDSAGNLLFYTDGSTIWNKNNDTMFNGAGLLGNFSSSDGALIVQKPGSNSTIYYVFTVDAIASGSGGTNGLNYTTVDITQQGGLGAVTSKNNRLNSSVNYVEKMTGIRATDDSDVWVIVHQGTNEFDAFLVTATGVSITPVVSNTGSVFLNGAQDEVGTMHPSLDGSKIAAAYDGGLEGFEVFNFDRTNGTLSSSAFLGDHLGAYSVCFSPSGRYLYGASYIGFKLWQFDLNNPSDTAGTQIFGTTGHYYGDMQLGPDNKIYVALQDLQSINNYLGTINDPENADTNCHFVAKSFFIDTAKCQIGIADFIFPKGHPAAAGINTLSNTNNLKIYPNPFYYKIFIDNKGSSSPIDRVTVRDITGRTMLNINSPLQNSIDLSALQAAMYFISVQTAKQCITLPVIKE